MKEQMDAKEKVNKRFDSINGLRSIAAICIIVMHIAFNSDYNIPSLRSTNILYFFDCFVFLFMVISGFGMCCGYFKKISEGSISISTFYEKRYSKILPFFAFLVFIDLVIGFSINSLLEGIADLTLVFSLLPNPNISVIGVGWTLGVIFLFYMLFPFFCFLLKTKKRAWLAFAISIFYNVAAQEYFLNSEHVVEGFRNRSNFAFCAMFFMAGGLIFLYKDEISIFVRKFRWIFLIVTWLISVGFVLRPNGINDSVLNIAVLVIFSLWVMYAIGSDGKILNNKLTSFISNISFEIYLCHMVVFRIVEKLNLKYIFGTGWLSYIFTIILVVVGAVLFSVCVKVMLKKIGVMIKSNKAKA